MIPLCIVIDAPSPERESQSREVPHMAEGRYMYQHYQTIPNKGFKIIPAISPILAFPHAVSDLSSVGLNILQKNNPIPANIIPMHDHMGIDTKLPPNPLPMKIPSEKVSLALICMYPFTPHINTHEMMKSFLSPVITILSTFLFTEDIKFSPSVLFSIERLANSRDAIGRSVRPSAGLEVDICEGFSNHSLQYLHLIASS
jgi:hypothetical protein